MRIFYTMIASIISGVLAATAILSLLLYCLSAPVGINEIWHTTYLSGFLAALAATFWFVAPADSLTAKIFCALIVPVGAAVDSSFLLLVLQNGNIPDHGLAYVSFYAGWALAASVPTIGVCYLMHRRQQKKETR